jgi:hypothetical protein
MKPVLWIVPFLILVCGSARARDNYTTTYYHPIGNPVLFSKD